MMVVDNVVMEDFLIQILLRLPVISLLRFKCVCKSWYSLINSPSFIAKHLLLNSSNNSNAYLLVKAHGLIRNGILDAQPPLTHIISYDTLEPVEPKFAPSTRYPLIHNKFTNDILIMGSCNGLLLLCYQFDMEWGIWNPATGETKHVPYCLFHKQPCRISSIAGAGFGFDAKNNDYKIVFIHIYDLDDIGRDIEVEVYSLKKDAWTFKESVKQLVLRWGIDYASDHCLSINDINGNGMYSCMAVTIKLIYEDQEQDQEGSRRSASEIVYLDTIVTFDMSNEIVITTRFPDEISYSHLYSNYPLVYKEESFAIASCVYNRDYEVVLETISFDIWVLGEYGVVESWNKLFTIGPLQGNVQRLLGFWKDTKIFAVTNDKDMIRNVDGIGIYNEDADVLCLHEPVTQETTSSLQISGKHIKLFTYKESLVSIKNLI